MGTSKKSGLSLTFREVDWLGAAKRASRPLQGPEIP